MLQLAIRGHNVTFKEHEGVKEEALKKCRLGGNPFDESRLWHMDMSDLPNPCEVSAMYMVHPAEDGGDDTIFARQLHWLSAVPRLIVQVKHACLLCFSRCAKAHKHFATGFTPQFWL